MSLTSIFNYLFVNNFFRILLITIIFMFIIRFLFKVSFQKCILTPIFSQLIFMISETIYALIIIILKIDINLTMSSAFLNMISNIIISIISIVLISIKYIPKLYNKAINFTIKIKNFQLSIFCIIIMFLANVLSMIVYYKIKFEYLLIFNVLMTIVCFLIVFYYFKTQNNYNKVSDKYTIALNSLKDYEKMMTRYRIKNHENKNLLLTVRAMILNKEKDIPKYIDSIVEEKYEDDDKLLMEMSVIPSGGLRATIYSEILKIKNNNINYSLNIDKKLRMVDLIELDENTIIDICKIIGVFIDNSIEEVVKLKNKNIQIQLYIDKKNIYIKVSNNYKTKIDTGKIYESGYSTKGKDHGYGLSMVKEITEKNNLLENNIEISKRVFSQILIIKYK